MHGEDGIVTISPRGLVVSEVPRSSLGMGEKVLRPSVLPQQTPPVSGPGSLEQDSPEGRSHASPRGFGLSGSRTLHRLSMNGETERKETMSEVLDLEPQPNLDTAAKRALIETE